LTIVSYLYVYISNTAAEPKKKNDEPSDMVRILSEMEKCTSNINFDG
jgi:hypothetical protein